MTSPTRLPPQSEPPLSPRLTLPTMYDLPKRCIQRNQACLMSAEGNLIPTPSEQVIAAQQQATAAQQRAEQLAARLRELGIDPDDLA